MRGLSDVRGSVRLPVVGLFALAVFAVFAVFVSGAMGQTEVQHGIGLTKGCTSPTKIGDPYTCSYTVRNVLDEAEDTLTISSLVDVVHAASGDVSSNIIGAAQITTTTTATGTIPSGATCVAASGNGVFPTPYTGVTSCTLPFGSRVNVLSFSPLHGGGRSTSRCRTISSATTPSCPGAISVTTRPGRATRTATRRRPMSGRPRCR